MEDHPVQLGASEEDPELLFDFAFAAAFTSAMSISAAIVIAVARSGLQPSTLLVVGCPILFIAAATAPLLVPSRWRRRLVSWRFAYPLLVLLVALSPVLVFVTGRWLALLYPIAAACGLFRATRLVVSRGTWRSHILLLAAPVLSLYVFAQLVQRPYAHIFAPEFAQLGILSLDTYFHTAIASMIQNFGQASTGLDGLVPIRYHVGSHIWFASLGRLTGSAPLSSYMVAQPTVAIPALYLALFLASRAVARSRESMPTYVVLATGLVLLFDQLGWNSYYISESYTLGLACMLLTVPLVVDFIDSPRASRAAECRRVAAMLAAVLIASALKVSVGLLLSGAFGYVLVRRGGASLRTLFILLSLSLVALLSLHTFQPDLGASLADIFEPFHFYRAPFESSGLDQWGPYARHASLLLPLVYVLLALFIFRRWRPSVSGRQLDRSAELMRAELVFVTTCAASLPGLTLNLPWGSAWWFGNVPQWLAIPFLLNLFTVHALRTTSRRAVTLAVGLAVILIGAYSASRQEPEHFFQLAERMVKKAGSTGRSISNGPAIRDYMMKSWSRNGSLFEPKLEARLDRSLLARVAVLTGEAKSKAQSDRFAVFVPPDNASFWSRRNCVAQPFLIPALAGVPMLKGVSPRCPHFSDQRRLAGNSYVFHGYIGYGVSSRSAKMDDTELCKHAAEREIESVFRLRSIEHPLVNRIVECGVEGR